MVANGCFAGGQPLLCREPSDSGRARRLADTAQRGEAATKRARTSVRFTLRTGTSVSEGGEGGRSGIEAE
ncbi:MAG: hypothetical protein DME26_10540 [Verrucomicrobia bacterium]|nr:MAG: hypothetical protein DME26_10540 [Verrucomicrobiota bacterium]